MEFAAEGKDPELVEKLKAAISQASEQTDITKLQLKQGR
jgi:hypothetical protein